MPEIFLITASVYKPTLLQDARVRPKREGEKRGGNIWRMRRNDHGHHVIAEKSRNLSHQGRMVKSVVTPSRHCAETGEFLHSASDLIHADCCTNDINKDKIAISKHWIFRPSLLAFPPSARTVWKPLLAEMSRACLTLRSLALYISNIEAVHPDIGIKMSNKGNKNLTRLPHTSIYPPSEAE